MVLDYRDLFKGTVSHRKYLIYNMESAISASQQMCNDTMVNGSMSRSMRLKRMDSLPNQEEHRFSNIQIPTQTITRADRGYDKYDLREPKDE